MTDPQYPSTATTSKCPCTPNFPDPCQLFDANADGAGDKYSHVFDTLHGPKLITATGLVGDCFIQLERVYLKDAEGIKVIDKTELVKSVRGCAWQLDKDLNELLIVAPGHYRLVLCPAECVNTVCARCEDVSSAIACCFDWVNALKGTPKLGTADICISNPAALAGTPLADCPTTQAALEKIGACLTQAKTDIAAILADPDADIAIDNTNYTFSDANDTAVLPVIDNNTGNTLFNVMLDLSNVASDADLVAKCEAINAQFEDLDKFDVLPNGNIQFFDDDGDTQILQTDDDVTGGSITLNGLAIGGTVVEGNTSVNLTPVTIPFAGSCAADTHVLAVVGGQIQAKSSADFKTTIGDAKRVALAVSVFTGAAVDALVGNVVHDIQMEVTNNDECYDLRYGVHLQSYQRWRWGVGNAQSWLNSTEDLNVLQSVGNNRWGGITNRAIWERTEGDVALTGYQGNQHVDTFSNGLLRPGDTDILRRTYKFEPAVYQPDPLLVYSLGLTQMFITHATHAPRLAT